MRIRPQRKNHKNRLFLQTTLMLAALVSVFGLMGFFKTEKVSSGIAVLLGLETAPKHSWVWCPQGLREMTYLPSQKRIQSAHEMASLCSVQMTPSSKEEIEKTQFTLLLKASGINSEVSVEASLTGDLFRISGLAFHSKNFRAQLDKLK